MFFFFMAANVSFAASVSWKSPKLQWKSWTSPTILSTIRLIPMRQRMFGKGSVAPKSSVAATAANVSLNGQAWSLHGGCAAPLGSVSVPMHRSSFFALDPAAQHAPAFLGGGAASPQPLEWRTVWLPTWGLRHCPIWVLATMRAPLRTASVPAARKSFSLLQQLLRALQRTTSAPAARSSFSALALVALHSHASRARGAAAPLPLACRSEPHCLTHFPI
mmetsp:Transcript_73401/g.127400  ORF Transcript_73401/g.127400 Transcript_73401/m.127400 type:complete len:219 (+) Transcript_73401:295-951(+)